MSKMIQIRNVPDALHRKLKARAANLGISMSEYLLREARRLAEQPTLEELQERMRARGPINIQVDIAQLIREDRDAR